MKKASLLTPYILFLTLALFWSFSFLAIRVSITFFPPIFSAMLRIGIAFLTLSIIFLLTKTSLKIPFKTARLIWLQGVLGQALPFLFLFWGEQYISPGLASILNATVPLWTILINGCVLREKNTFTIKKTLGLLLGLFGIIVIFAPMITPEHKESTQIMLLGIFFLTAMSISYASAAILYQRILAKHSVELKASVWHQHIGSFVFAFIVSLLMDSWPNIQSVEDISMQGLTALLYLGVFSTALAYLMYSYLIAQWGAVRAVSAVYVVPVFSVIWDILFLQLPVHIYEFIGMAIILMGVLFVQLPEQPPELSSKS